SIFSNTTALAGYAAFVLAVPAVATAQDASPLPAAEHFAVAGDKLEQITVTAQRRETNLQQTPISMAVASAEALDQRHVESIVDLADGSIPSLRVRPTFSRTSSLQLSIRGIGSGGDAQAARDQAVGVYLDGVFLGRAQGLGAALYDVERIEVLNGPQGTLFGRNSEAGAVSIVSRKPTGRLGFDLKAGVSSFDGRQAEAHVNLPEFAGLSIKLDGVMLRRDGTIDNPAPGQRDFNAYDRKGGVARVLWQPSDAFSADYAFDYSHDATTPTLTQLLAPGSAPLAPLIEIQSERATSTPIGVPLQWSIGKTYGHRLNLDWRFSDALRLRSISSYRNLVQSQYDNGAVVASIFAPNAPFARYSLANVDQEQYSQELQLLGSFEDLELVGGAFYYREEVSDSARTPNILQWNATGTAYTTLNVDLDKAPFDRAAHVTTQSAGAFGQIDWTPSALDGRARLSLGGRYTHDAKKGSLDVLNGAIPSYLNASGQLVTGVIPLDDSWNRFDPLVALGYDVSASTHVYGKWTTGYRAGGANSRSLTFRAFGPESVAAFELGLKTELFDRRLRFNLAAFHQKLKNRQVDFTTRILPNNRNTTETVNASSGTSKGVEIDTTLLIMRGLTASLSYAFNDVSLSDVLNPFTNTIQSGVVTGTPRNAGSASLDFERPVGDASLRLHLDGAYSQATFSNTGDPSGSDEMLLFNARAAISDLRMSNGASLELVVWARNLFNKSVVVARSLNSMIGSIGVFNEPRTVGVEARIRF
ncbi:MAG TPA: TonB-dependent receptor, partial [Pseudorhodoplanes sp.]|nr:TonB-dependent receptor [Pseudorhodoplanes sp.]